MDLSLKNKSEDIMEITCNTEEFQQLDKTISDLSNCHIVAKQLDKTIDDLSNCHMEDNSIAFEKYINEQFSNVNGKLDYVYQLLNELLGKVNSHQKPEKIHFNNTDSIENIIYFSDNLGCLIQCTSNNNFGKVVGRNGYNINYFMNTYKINVQVPKKSEKCYCIVLFNYNDDYNTFNLETVKDDVVKLLS